MNGDTIASTADLTLNTDASWTPTTLHLIITDEDLNCSQTVSAFIDFNYNVAGCTVLNLDAPYTIIAGDAITLSSIIGLSSYSWTNISGEELSTENEFSITPSVSDSFNLYWTDGVCEGYCSIYIALGVLPFDAISPNGDGMNDEWVIRDLERYPDAIVKVFNRWGQLLLEIDGPSYPSNDFNWEELNVGTYYYIIDLGNGNLPQTGPITIIK